MSELNIGVVTLEGKPVVKDFDIIHDLALGIIERSPITIITNDDEMKQKKELATSINKAIEKISRQRIDSVRDLVGTFEGQCKELEDLLETHRKAIMQSIKDYKDSKKEVVSTEVANKPKLITATLKFYDVKVAEKLKTFAEKNGCELTIK